MMKKYKTSKNLLFKVRNILADNDYDTNIVVEAGQPYIETNASSGQFHKSVVRALCQKISSDTGFPHISNVEVNDQVYFQEIREVERVDSFAVVNNESRNKGAFVPIDDDYVDKITNLIIPETVENGSGYLEINISDKDLKEKATHVPINQKHPEIISVFDTTLQQAQKLTGLAIHKEIENVATWVKNADIGEQMVVFRDLRTDIGHGYTNGMHMSKRIPLTGINVWLEADDIDSFKVISSYPCLAGDDIDAFRRDMGEWKAHYQNKRNGSKKRTGA